MVRMFFSRQEQFGASILAQKITRSCHHDGYLAYMFSHGWWIARWSTSRFTFFGWLCPPHTIDAVHARGVPASLFVIGVFCAQ